ncbi:hypothetical protein A6U87_05925 [Rhizobium sp. AC44/96]|uniref:DUF982 domain-containing protein n=1 Tax=unclassified Rhizobium TaxID=2613769 RepID=UPI00080FB5EB|nr:MULTISPECIES: DUF982 domain-containing protein [unclassified Rhizobium]MDM9623292.1 DUF982 domain-containing protein [Rhizobium sp. S96]OCJ12851.1 hypothetical protein A6U87_05925 [Rhizobium sp. AC44/96]
MESNGWVTVTLQRHGKLHTINSVGDALDMLISRWPVSDGVAYIGAMEACVGTEEGGVSSSQARAAFLLAAVEAGIYFEARV